jgi:RsiW-degrading membrane proteinase PrsW (M82 family)
MFFWMDLNWKGIKGIILSLLKYYGIVICTFAISIPLGILGMFIAISLEGIVNSPDAYDSVFYPFLVGFCFIVMLPFILIGLFGLYFILFFKFKKKQKPVPPPYGHYHPYGYDRNWYPQYHQPPQTPKRSRKEKDEVKTFNLPSIRFSIIVLSLMVIVCILAYSAVVAGALYTNLLTFILLLVGTVVLVFVFPFLFTYPPIMWIQILQRGKSLLVSEQNILTALAWGMLSPVPVIFVGLTFDLIFHGATGYSFPDWVDTALMAPIIEEFFKALGLTFLFSRIRNQYDGLILGFCCGVGFAVVENLLYFGATALTGFEEGLGGAILSWTFVIVVRSAKSTMSHGMGSAIIGYTIGYFKWGLRNGKQLWFLPVVGYVIAVGFHAAWNGFIVFLDVMVPENMQDSLILNVGMMVWIVSFFFMELFLLLLLKFTSRNAEERELAKKRRLRKRSSIE